jgi:hypothetical protein
VAKAAYTHHFAGNVWSLMAIRWKQPGML